MALKVEDFVTRLPLTALLLPTHPFWQKTYTSQGLFEHHGLIETSQPMTTPRMSTASTFLPPSSLETNMATPQSTIPSANNRWSAHSASFEQLLEDKWRQRERTRSVSDGIVSFSSKTSSDNTSDSSNESSPRKMGFIQTRIERRKTIRMEKKIEDESMGSVEALRNKFLDYVKSYGVKHGHESIDIDFEVKLLFMDYVYDGITRKPSKNLKDIPTTMLAIETFCHNIICCFDYSFSNWHSTQEQYPYLKYMVREVVPKQPRWFSHSRLCKFLIDRFDNTLTKEYPPLKSDEVPNNNYQQYSATILHTPLSVENNHLTPKVDNQVGLIDEIHMLCDMFYYQLEDFFVLFQVKYQDYVHRWVKEGLGRDALPLNVIEVYKRKLEYNELMQTQFQIDARDFVSTNVIDKDWKFLRYLCKEYSPDWFVSFKNVENAIQWTTKNDYSTDILKLRIAKIISYYDAPIIDVVKSFCHDKHMAYAFEGIEYHDYHPINFSNSLQKYPSTLVSATFSMGSVFSKRKVELVLSSKSTFVGTEMTEHMLLYKSCEIPGLDTRKKKNTVRARFLGLRLISKIDSNRTRCVELRCSNLGGIINTDLILNNSKVKKEIVKTIHNGLVKAVEECRKEGFPIPKDDHLYRIWEEYCKHYCGINLTELLATQFESHNLFGNDFLLNSQHSSTAFNSTPIQHDSPEKQDTEIFSSFDSQDQKSLNLVSIPNNTQLGAQQQVSSVSSVWSLNK